MTKHFRYLCIIFLLGAVLTAPMISPKNSHASEPYIGQIQMFGFNFPPRGWAHCNGQLLAISQYQSLFSLLGTTFGGDGRTTFGLPDLRGRTAVHPGTGPGLTPVTWGQKAGAQTRTLAVANLPSHTHGATATVNASSVQGRQQGPWGNVLAYDRRETQYSSAAPDVEMSASSVTVSVANTGGNQAFDIRDPFLGIYHSIALQGLFPSRN